jgi:hypothetical protein
MFKLSKKFNLNFLKGAYNKFSTGQQKTDYERINTIQVTESCINVQILIN